MPGLSLVEARLRNAEILKGEKTTSAEPDQRGKCSVISLLLLSHCLLPSLSWECSQRQNVAGMMWDWSVRASSVTNRCQ